MLLAKGLLRRIAAAQKSRGKIIRHARESPTGAMSCSRKGYDLFLLYHD